MVSFFVLDFLITKRSVLQGKIVNMQGRFLSLLRDGSITSGKMSDKIKDFSKLLQLLRKETVTAGDKNFIIPKNLHVSNTLHLKLLIVVS